MSDVLVRDTPQIFRLLRALKVVHSCVVAVGGSLNLNGSVEAMNTTALAGVATRTQHPGTPEHSQITASQPVSVSKDVIQGDGLRVGLVSRDGLMTETVAGICASAGASLQVTEPGATAGLDVQLLDIQALQDAPTLRGDSSDVVLLGRSDDTGLWEAAALLGGCPVAVMPDAEAWLADRLSPRANSHQNAPAVVVGIAGAVGGVGASTVACWLAADAATDGAHTVLVDADPDGCGIDLVLGLESLEATRWPDLSHVRGVLHGEQLMPLLPEHPDQSGLQWLSWGREYATEIQVPASPVLAALRSAAHVVVVDLGRVRDGSQSLANQCDIVVVAMSRTVRGVLAAHRAAALLSPTPVEYVLCGVDVADIDDALIAQTLGKTPLGVVRFDGRVPELAESGRLLERGRKRPHKHCVSAIWDQLTDRLGATTSGGAR